MTSSNVRAFLSTLLERRVNPSQWAAFVEALARARPPVERNRLLAAFTGMSRKLGKTALAVREVEQVEARGAGVETPLAHWGLDEAGRAVLLLTLAEGVAADEFETLVLDCHESGDAREQASWLRVLGLLPEAGRFLGAATDACRTNIIPLFESIACENPYPARHFPDLNFNQMVLKALFNVVSIDRIIGLDDRFNVEMSRMANDYVSEREAAGRPFPPDIWLAVAPRIPEADLGAVYRYLRHADPQHRYWAARGLGYRADAAGRGALETQRSQESEAEVIVAMDRSLTAMNG